MSRTGDDLEFLRLFDPEYLNANTNAKNKRKKTTPFNDDSFKNMIHHNVLNPDDPDPEFTELTRKVEPIPHEEMKDKGQINPNYHIDDFWGDDVKLPEFGDYNPKNYPVLNSNKKQRVKGGKKQKTNKKIKSKKNKKRSKRTRKNRKSKK